MGRLLWAAVVLAGCSGSPTSGTGFRIDDVRVVPPAPGECVGSLEVVAVNEGAHDVTLFGMRVDEGGQSDGAMDRLLVSGPITTGFVVFGRERFPKTLAPGSYVTTRFSMVRTGAPIPKQVTIQCRSGADAEAREYADHNSEPINIVPADWPSPAPLTADLLDSGQGPGRAPRIVFCESYMPGGGALFLDLLPSGYARGKGEGSQSGDPKADIGLREGVLSEARRVALQGLIRTAPYSAFSVDPANLQVEDGQPVRLLVIAGPAAFVGGSQVDDFKKAGLTPLLDGLRAAFRDLPVVATWR